MNSYPLTIPCRRKHLICLSSDLKDFLMKIQSSSVSQHNFLGTDAAMTHRIIIKYTPSQLILSKSQSNVKFFKVYCSIRCCICQILLFNQMLNQILKISYFLAQVNFA